MHGYRTHLTTHSFAFSFIQTQRPKINLFPKNKTPLILFQQMNRNPPFLNKYTKQKQLEITDTYHNLNMKEIRPITTKLMQHSQTITINHSKQKKIKEVRENQIDRENRILLDKISHVMTRRGTYSMNKTKNFRTKVNKSLNQIFRKKQEEQIIEENKRFSERLQKKKPTLNIQKLNRDWKDNQSVIKRMQHYQFYLTSYKSKESYMKNKSAGQGAVRNKLENSRISRIFSIGGFKMMVKIEFTNGWLKIIGDTLNNTNLKVIEIPKEEGLIYINQQCGGKLEGLLEKLKYNQQKETLYIDSEILAQDNDSQSNPEAKKSKKDRFIDMSKKKDHKTSSDAKSAKVEKSIEVIDEEQENSIVRSTKNQKVEIRVNPLQPQQQQFQEEKFEESFKEEAESPQTQRAKVDQSIQKLPQIVVQPQQPQNYDESPQKVDSPSPIS